MIKDKYSTCLSAAVVACLAGARVAGAQEEATTFLEEIVVTAQKRVEKLQDVPIAVTVVDQMQLENQNIYAIDDLARTSPSLEMVQAFGGPGGGGQIRGIGTNSLTRSAEGAVGIVVDGVPQGNVNTSSIFDMQRVEVLRGPQGTLFGLTSSAGVINMTTVAPNFAGFEGNLRLEYSGDDDAGSQFGEQVARAVVNVPIGEHQALRISGTFQKDEGIQHNNFSDEDTDQRDVGVRARYRFAPSEDFEMNLIADYGTTDRNFNEPQFTYVSANPSLTAALAACGITPGYENNARCGNHLDQFEQKNFGASAQFDIALGSVMLTSITGYRKVEADDGAFDIKGLASEDTQIFSFGALRDASMLTQELRFASQGENTVDYTTGLFYSKLDDKGGSSPDGAFRVTGRAPFPPFAPGFTYVNLRQETEIINESFAAFGQATFNVSDQLGLIAGLRYTSQKIEDSSSGNLNDPVPVPAFGSVEEDDLSGRFGLTYRFNPDLTSYLTYTRGYKGPQVTPAAQGQPTVVLPAETPDAYEIGIKGGLLGGELGFDASLFYTDVKNYQGQRCAISPLGTLTCIGDSVPSVKTEGIELALYGRPVESVTLTGGYIYNIAEYPDGYTGYDPENLNNGTTDLSGEQIVGVPKQKFTLSGEYSKSFGGMEGYFAADTVFRSEIRMGPTADPRFVYPSYWELGARLGVRSSSGKWNVGLFGRNLTNEPVPVTLFGGPSFTPPNANPAAPNGYVNGVSGWLTAHSLRQIGLSVDMRF